MYFISLLKKNKFTYKLCEKVKHILKYIYYFKEYFKIKQSIRNIHNKREKCIIFISTPTHGNLGDHAIVYAQYIYFQTIGYRDNICEINEYLYNLYRDNIQKIISKDDLIVIDGGGNIGTLWIEVEERIRDIILRFNDNPIIIFPESAYFSNDNYGKKQLDISQKIYSVNKKLYVFLRDKKSYNFMKNNFDINCYCVPDIVLSLKVHNKNAQRKGVLLCLRKDKEKVLSNNTLYKIEQKLRQTNENFFFTDTVVNKKIFPYQRIKELNKIWENFSKSKLIITDRLHGMIFAALTGTPCIAFDNINKKVSAVYEWINSLNYIFCIKEDDFSPLLIDKAIATKADISNFEYIQKDFNHIYDICNKILSGDNP